MSFHIYKRFTAGIFFVFLAILIISNTVWASGASDVSDSLAYLKSQQNNDGGLKDVNPFSSSSDSQDGQSAWAAVAYSSAGIDPNTVKFGTEGFTLLQYIESKACGYTQATDIERTILALRASGITPGQFLDCDLNAKLESLEDTTTGKIGPDIVSTVFGVLAYSAYDHAVTPTTISYIKSQQDVSGGWTDGFGVESNSTAETVMALRAANVPVCDDVFIKAKAYFKSLQTDTGGIKYDNGPFSTDSDAFSDAYTVQAIYALNENPLSDFWLSNGKSVFDDLTTLREGNGAYEFANWGESLPVYTTAIVVPSLQHQPLPVKPTILNPYGSDPVTPFSPTLNNDNCTPVTPPVTPPSTPPQTTNPITTTNVDTNSATTQPTTPDSQPANQTTAPEKPVVETTSTPKVTTFTDQSSTGTTQKTDTITQPKTAPVDSGTVLGTNTNKNTGNPNDIYWNYASAGLVGIFFGWLFFILFFKRRRKRNEE